MVFIFMQYSDPRCLYKSVSSHPNVMAENQIMSPNCLT